MRIRAIKIYDFKGLRQVELTDTDRAIVVISGKNGAGKTSCLDAIQAVLGGARECPDVPVRVGKESGSVAVDLGELRAKRVMYKDGRSKLIVENADKSRPPAPQALLDKMFSRVAFDPQEFHRWPSEKQAKVLRMIGGIEQEVIACDIEHKRLNNECKDIDRAIAQDRAALGDFPDEDKFMDAPDQPVSLEDLLAEQERLHGENLAIEAASNACQRAMQELNEVRNRRGDRCPETCRTGKLPRGCKERWRRHGQTGRSHRR